MKLFKHNVNSEISLTYITSKKKMTLIAALGVMIGIALFIFMNSLAQGFSRASNESIFKTVPHLRVFKDTRISQSLLKDSIKLNVIINPKIILESQQINNPQGIIQQLKKEKEVVSVTDYVTSDLFINIGNVQIKAAALGIHPIEADKMFSISSFLVEGALDNLDNIENGIIVGIGLADKLSLRMNNYLSIVSPLGVKKTMKVVGFFETKNSKIDKTQIYMNIKNARQLLKKPNDYVSEIYINVKNYENLEKLSEQYSNLTGYTVESWQKSNEQLVAADNMRKIIIRFISISILLIGGFGIYNILNMTILQKINEIAILKAIGFQGKDVIQIFVQQAIITGIMGVLLGMIMASVLVWRLQHVYVGGDIGYFPIRLEPIVFFIGALFGLFLTFLAGFIPAKKAANVDPISIFRK